MFGRVFGRVVLPREIWYNGGMKENTNSRGLQIIHWALVCIRWPLAVVAAIAISPIAHILFKVVILFYCTINGIDYGEMWVVARWMLAGMEVYVSGVASAYAVYFLIPISHKYLSCANATCIILALPAIFFAGLFVFSLVLGASFLESVRPLVCVIQYMIGIYYIWTHER